MPFFLRPLFIAAVVFFLSGSSALIFQTLWFRVASQVLGSSVYSAAAVLMAFMAGLGLGNLILAVGGEKVKRPFRLYIIIEIVIAIAGVATVYFLPVLASLASTSLAAMSSDVAILSLARFTLAFSVLVLPAVAMGATLPVLQKALHHYDTSFSSSIGRLYGWNTVGAVAGTLIAEFMLIKLLGVSATAFLAAGLNIIAAVVVFIVFKDSLVDGTAQEQTVKKRSTKGVRLILVAPFLAGFVLLALEVVWFRYITLSQVGTSIIFAVMLAIVLIGLAIGGLLVIRLNTLGQRLSKLLKILPMISLLMVVAGYVLFQYITVNHPLWLFSDQYIFIIPATLMMLPVSIISGMLFPLYGEWLYRHFELNTKASGLLTLVNTLGAAIGSAVATFYLLPQLGIEKAVLVLAVVYGFLTIVVVFTEKVKLTALALPLACMAVVAFLFPLGSMDSSYAKVGSFRYKGEELVEVKEELNATLQYFKTDYLNQPLSYRLVTNSYSMSSSNFYSRRYMELFVYLPYALHPEIKDVLQISYGVGNTAEAVVSLDTMESYDVVDISGEILTLSDIIHSSTGIYPLRDKRATSIIEDGRFYLQTREKKYDLITGEPPPPKMAGIANLYTEEYFQLIKARLKDKGLVSYWLPVHNLYDGDSLAILKAFCNVFDDCSLWNGGGLDWIMLGSNGGIDKVKPYAISALWYSPIGKKLKAIGVENPGQMAALFMADNQMLRELTASTKAVTDNYPQRISPDYADVFAHSDFYEALMNIQKRKQKFWESEYIDSIFYPPTKKMAMNAYQQEGMITAAFMGGLGYLKDYSLNWKNIYPLIQAGNKTLPILWYGLDPQKAAMIEAGKVDSSHPEYPRELGLYKMSLGQFQAASELLGGYIKGASDQEKPRLLQFYHFAKMKSIGYVSDAQAVEMDQQRLPAGFIAWLKNL